MDEARRDELPPDLAARVRGSRFWNRAMTRARDYVDGERDLGGLVRRVTARLEGTPLVGPIVDDAATSVRLVRAYVDGRYRDVAVEDLLLIVAGLVYFVSPADLVPDVLAGVGLVDDVAVLTFVLRSVPAVLGRFRAFEARQLRRDPDAAGEVVTP